MLHSLKKLHIVLGDLGWREVTQGQESSGFGEGPNEPWKGSVIWFHRNFRSQDKTKNYKGCFSLTRSFQASTWIEKLWTFFRHHCDWPRSLCHCHSSASPPGTGGSANTVDVVLRWIKTAFGQEIPETFKEETNMLYVVLSRLQFCRWTATKNERYSMIARKQAWCAAVCFLYSPVIRYWSKRKIVKKWTTLQTPLKTPLKHWFQITIQSDLQRQATLEFLGTS